jgi:(1->4)-alpha-D-glucan 1-alpha-D-glucosylmutase
LPVYRTYVVPERDEIDEDDVRDVEEAIEAAKINRPELDAELFDFIRDILLLRIRGELESEFVLRFQQFSGPVMAKGVEDTAFYCFNRLLALNEVGGDPGRFGVSPASFHEFCARAQQSHPRTMLASSTHDTKRSEDVRARLALLSEIPEEWRKTVTRWAAHNAAHKTNGCPDAGTEYFLYQTLVGAWPIELERLQLYMEKATREAKRKTSWLAPHEPFEAATRRFVEAVLHDRAFLDDLENFVRPLVTPGRVNSLALTLLKLTSPGIPDFYQGSELWDLSLVDPDNRRPVDYAVRRRLLSELPRLTAQQAWGRQDEGLPKLWTVQHGLRVRCANTDCFDTNASYEPLWAKGPKAAHTVAYLRAGRVLTVVPRLILTVGDDWSGTYLEIPEGRWKDALSGQEFNGGTVLVEDILASFPVALLVQ